MPSTGWLARGHRQRVAGQLGCGDAPLGRHPGEIGLPQLGQHGGDAVVRIGQRPQRPPSSRSGPAPCGALQRRQLHRQQRRQLVVPGAVHQLPNTHRQLVGALCRSTIGRLIGEQGPGRLVRAQQQAHCSNGRMLDLDSRQQLVRDELAGGHLEHPRDDPGPPSAAWCAGRRRHRARCVQGEGGRPRWRVAHHLVDHAGRDAVVLQPGGEVVTQVVRPAQVEPVQVGVPSRPGDRPEVVAVLAAGGTGDQAAPLRPQAAHAAQRPTAQPDHRRDRPHTG
jgi:hypothetical protein